MNQVERQITGPLKDAIVETFKSDDWVLLGIASDSENIIQGYNRLLRSLSFEDDDYEFCDLEVLKKLMEAGKTTYIVEFTRIKSRRERNPPVSSGACDWRTVELLVLVENRRGEMLGLSRIDVDLRRGPRVVRQVWCH